MPAVFDIVAAVVRRDSPSEVYVEYLPTNPELRYQVMHGQTLDIGWMLPEVAVREYRPKARRAMFEVVSVMFPGQYVEAA